jgi:hypothetical protein
VALHIQSERIRGNELDLSRWGRQHDAVTPEAGWSAIRLIGRTTSAGLASDPFSLSLSPFSRSMEFQPVEVYIL